RPLFEGGRPHAGTAPSPAGTRPGPGAAKPSSDTARPWSLKREEVGHGPHHRADGAAHAGASAAEAGADTGPDRGARADILPEVQVIVPTLHGLKLGHRNRLQIHDSPPSTYETPTPAPDHPARHRGTCAGDSRRVASHPGM